MRKKHPLLTNIPAVLTIVLAVFLNGIKCGAECGSGSNVSSPVTINDEPNIPGSRQLVGGSGSSVNLSIPGQVMIDVTGSGATAPLPYTLSTNSSSSTFSPAVNTYTKVTAASQINLPASASVPVGSVYGFAIGTQGAVEVKTNAGAGTERIIFNGSTTNGTITINSGDEIFLVNQGGGDWLVTNWVPFGGSVGSVLSVPMGGTGASTASGARASLGAAASGANSDITSLSGLTTALSIGQGGTGKTSLTPHGVLIGNGTSGINVTSTGTSGQVLTSNGASADPTWQDSGGGGGGGFGGIETISVTAINHPAAPTVTVTGTAGSTTYEYLIVAKDSNGNYASGFATLITNGNATLSGSNYNALSWSSVSGAATYDVYRIAGPSTLGKITNTASTSYNDQSNSGGDGLQAPAVTGVTRAIAITSTNQTTQLLDCTNGDLVVTLPDASSCSGKCFLFKRIDSTKNTAKIIGYSTQIVALNRNVCTIYNKGNPLWIQSSGGTSWRTLNQASGPTISFAALPPKKTRGCADWGTENMLMQGSDGNIYGWGLATNGNIAGGISSGTEIARPVVFDPNNPPANGAYIIDWAASGENLYVVFSDGTVYGAGLNNYGQLGLSNTTSSNYLQKITFFNSIPVVKVWTFSAGSAVAGLGKTFFQINTGAIYACGYNATGSLGVGSTSSPISTPTSVPGVYNPFEIKSGHTVSGSYTSICDATGSLYVTGYNGQGQLGTGSTSQLTSFTKITSISGAGLFVNAFPYGGNTTGTNSAFNAVLDNNGILYMAGLNTYGQHGQGNSTASTNVWYKLCANAAYTTGTVAVSGTAVTGSSTAWTSIDAPATSLQIGFGSTNPGSISTWYSIASINSNTSITLTSSAGTVGSGSAYVIKVIPPANPIVDFAWTGHGNLLSCLALDSTGKILTWGYNASNSLFYANTTNPQTAPTVNATNAKSISAANSPAAVACRNSVYWDGSKFHVGGTTLNGFIGPTDSSYASGSIAVSLPESINSGGEIVTDMMVNNNGSNCRIFILTDYGNLYASGDNTNGVCTGGASAAAGVGMFKIGI